MLETNKTYTWGEFWKYCKVGETYNITITEGVYKEGCPILKGNEIYLCEEYYYSAFYLATDFIKAFKKLIGEELTKQYKLSTSDECSFTGKDTYYESFVMNHSEIKMDIDDVYELMETYGVEDIKVFMENYLAKLPNVTNIYEYSGYIDIELDLEPCDDFGDVGEYTITIKNKTNNIIIDVNGKGSMGCDDQNWYGMFDDVKLVITDIL